MVSTIDAPADTKFTGNYEPVPVLGSEIILKGTVVSLRGGYLVDGDNTSGDVHEGIALDHVDMTGLASGAKFCRVDIGGPRKLLNFKPLPAATGGTCSIVATGGTLTSITVGGVEILGSTVTWATSTTVFAALVAKTINRYRSTVGHNFYATSAAGVITIRNVMPVRGTQTVIATEAGGDLASTDVDLSAGLPLDIVANGKTSYMVDNDTCQETSTNVTLGKVCRVYNDDGELMQQVQQVGKFTVTGATGATFTSVKVGGSAGTEVLGAAVTVSWTTSNTNSALLIADAINLYLGTSGYIADVSGAQVIVKKIVPTNQVNGADDFAFTGDITYTVDQPMRGGKTAKAWVQFNRAG